VPPWKKPLEIPIETIDLDGNRASHFDPIWGFDVRIFFVLVRFTCPRSWQQRSTCRVLRGLCPDRKCSGGQDWCFTAATVSSVLWRYYSLVAAIGALSYLLILTLNRYGHWNVFVAKITVDSLLSLVSFSIQASRSPAGLRLARALRTISPMPSLTHTSKVVQRVPSSKVNINPIQVFVS
jgi:hypothetical protein